MVYLIIYVDGSYDYKNKVIYGNEVETVKYWNGKEYIDIYEDDEK